MGGTPEVLEPHTSPTGNQVPAKGSILSTTVRHRLSPIVGVQRGPFTAGKCLACYAELSSGAADAPEESSWSTLPPAVEQVCCLD